MSEQLKQPWVC